MAFFGHSIVFFFSLSFTLFLFFKVGLSSQWEFNQKYIGLAAQSSGCEEEKVPAKQKTVEIRKKKNKHFENQQKQKYF